MSSVWYFLSLSAEWGCSKSSVWHGSVEKAFDKSDTALATCIVWFCSIWCPVKINIGLTKDLIMGTFFSVPSHSKLICRNSLWWHLRLAIKICNSPTRKETSCYVKVWIPKPVGKHCLLYYYNPTCCWRVCLTWLVCLIWWKINPVKKTF